MANTITITKLSNGNVLVDRTIDEYSLNPDMQVIKKVSGPLPGCAVRHKNGSTIDTYFVQDVLKVVRRDGTETTINDLDTLFFELTNFFFFKFGAGGSNHIGRFENYTDLITQFPSSALFDLAYVENSQGTVWLPGTLGGSFFSKGTYIWNGTIWDSAVDEIAKQLEDNIIDINSVTTSLLNHLNDLTNPHDTSIINLFDTVITGILNDHGIFFNTTSGKWENKIGGSNIQSDWNETDNIEPAFIKNKPSIITGPGGETIIDGGFILGDALTLVINGNTDNLTDTELGNVVVLRLDFTGNFSLSGITPPDDTLTWMLYVVNVGIGNCSLKNNDAGSLPSARFLIGQNRNLQTDEGILFFYDSVSKRYRGSGIIN